MTPASSSYRTAAAVVVLLLIGSSSVALARLYQAFASGPAGDYLVYCAAARTAHEGTNPYLTANIGTYHAFVYPPASLPLFSLLCSSTNSGMIWIQVLGLATLLVISLFLARISPIIGLLLLSFGFGAFEWNVQTGNIATIEAVCLGMALVASQQRRPRITALALGLMGMMKLIPLFYAVAWLVFEFLTGPRDTRVKRIMMYASIAALPAALFQLLSFLLYPQYLHTYWTSLLGGIPGQHSPLYEQSSNPSHPSLLLFLRATLSSAGIPDALTFVAYGLCALGLIGSLRTFKNRPKTDQLAALMVLTSLLLPRLKPYSFMAAIVPMLMLYATLRPGSLPRMFCLLAAVGLPLLARLHGSGWGVDLVLGFSQWIALVVSYFMTVIPSGTGLKPTQSGTPMMSLPRGAFDLHTRPD